MGWVRAGLGAVALAACAGEASGAPPAELWVSEYHSTEGCPGEFTFRSQVQARTSRAQLTPAEQAPASAGVRRFVVRLRTFGQGYAGSLEIWRDGVSSENRLTAPTCDEVVAGLAIAAALSVESAPPDGGSPAAAPPEREASEAAATRPEVAPSDPVSTKGSSGEPPTSGHWLFGVSLGVGRGYAPGWNPTAGVSSGRTPARSSAGLAWRANLGAALGETISSNGTQQLSLDVGWFGGSAELCPLTATPSDAFRALACASLELGVLNARTDRERSLRPWVAPGVVVRLEARFGDVFLEPSVGLHAPLVRDVYWFRPDEQAYRVPWGAAKATVTGGIVF